VLWPDVPFTKGDLIAYYGHVSSVMLPFLKDRPLSLKRYPDGISGDKFFQKNISDKHAPAFLKLATIPAKTIKKDVHYAVANNEQTLSYLANIAAIELHPWNSRLKTLDRPDFVVFDLDPGDRTRFSDVVDAAHAVKDLLDMAKLESYVKTSGKRGLHVYVPLSAKYAYEAVRTYARRLAQKVEQAHPGLVSTATHPEQRRDKIFIDYLRNAIGQTVIAPYCPRGTPEATVSTPLDWREVTYQLDLKQFTVKTILQRLASKGDIWAPLLRRASRLPDLL
jgi:bifunctional non-homologous end joining protein LigD